MVLTDVATSDVVTASRDTDVTEVLDRMDENEVGSVVVADGDEPVGFVSDRMIAMGLRDVDPSADVSVGDVMADEPVTVSEDATHVEALETMSEHAIRRLPIVDDGGSLTGIVTLDDLLVVSATELGHAAEVVEQQAGPL